MYVIKVNGTIPLTEDVESAKLSEIIEKKFSDIMSLSENTLYISGQIDESQVDLLRKFIIKILPVVDKANLVTIKFRGDDVEHRYDLVIYPSGACLKYGYELESDEDGERFVKKQTPEIILEGNT